MIPAEIGAGAAKAWYEYVNGGGEFFSHFVFTLLVSVVLSTKWRDYLIEPRKDDMEEFRQEVAEEIKKVKLSERLDPRFKANIQKKFESYRDEAKKLRTELASSTCGTTKWCKGWCWGSLVVTIAFIAAGWDKILGFLCVLGLLPIPIYRHKMDQKYDAMHERYDNLRKKYEEVQDVCQSQYDDKLKTEDDKFRSFSNARRISIRRTAE